MKRNEISEALGAIGTRHIQEAAEERSEYGEMRFFRSVSGRAVAAAALALCLLAGGILGGTSRSMVVTAYAQESGEEITASEAVLHTGTIHNDGEMTGHPLMFYLSGKNIETVRFSCKNQQISFMDWTEQRDEFGLAQNFTVTYGDDESEYYYLLIDWVPNGIIHALTDDAETTISSLPKELREDTIVMEITFANGTTKTKAIEVFLLDDGTFSAAFDDYRITDEDEFVFRPDSNPVSREMLQSSY